MPKATVDEDRDPRAAKDDIHLASNVGLRASVLAKAVAPPVKLPPQRDLRFRVRLAVAAHDSTCGCGGRGRGGWYSPRLRHGIDGTRTRPKASRHAAHEGRAQREAIP